MTEKNKLKGYLPGFIADDPTFAQWFTAVEQVLEAVDAKALSSGAQKWANQVDAQHIERLELIFGAENTAGTTLEQRRAAIIGKMMGGITTVEQTKRLIAAYSGHEAEVEERFDEYLVNIKFIAENAMPECLEDMAAAVRRLLPAHLGIEIGYRIERTAYVRCACAAAFGKTVILTQERDEQIC